jgi:hypothetical protein
MKSFILKIVWYFELCVNIFVLNCVNIFVLNCVLIYNKYVHELPKLFKILDGGSIVLPLYCYMLNVNSMCPRHSHRRDSYSEQITLGSNQ